MKKEIHRRGLYNALILSHMQVINLTLNDLGNYSCCIKTASNGEKCATKTIKRIIREQHFFQFLFVISFFLFVFKSLFIVKLLKKRSSIWLKSTVFIT